MAYSSVGFAHIIDYIHEGVLTGRFTEGGRIPSVRDMAELMQVAPNTVVHAYDKLERRGLVHTMRGIGYFISEGAVEAIRADKRRIFHEEMIPRHSTSKLPTNGTCPAHPPYRDEVCGARLLSYGLQG